MNSKNSIINIAKQTIELEGQAILNLSNLVNDDFWESTKNIMQGHFKRGHFKQGLVDGILKAGKELETYFPWQHNDTNELSNDISKG